ncbi:MAG: hypothetical protein AAGJ83_11405 [Planctomycetota bacterium]
MTRPSNHVQPWVDELPNARGVFHAFHSGAIIDESNEPSGTPADNVSDERVTGILSAELDGRSTVMLTDAGLVSHRNVASRGISTFKAADSGNSPPIIKPATQISAANLGVERRVRRANPNAKKQIAVH